MNKRSLAALRRCEPAKRILIAASIVASGVILAPVAADAREFDKLTIAAGGYSVIRYDSTISFTETNAGVGVSISPRDTLGLDGEQTVFRLDGIYRFNANHAISLTWYRITSTATRTLLEDIEWIGNDGNSITIPVGTFVSSWLGYDIYKFGYLWSFYHSDKVELTAGAGLHYAQVGVDLNLNTSTTGLDARKADTNVPLPVLTLAMAYTVTPRFNWYAKMEAFAMAFNEWSGTYTDVQAGLEYRIHEHFGVGLGLGTNALRLQEESTRTRFNFDNRITGLYMYVSGHF